MAGLNASFGRMSVSARKVQAAALYDLLWTCAETPTLEVSLGELNAQIDQYAGHFRHHYHNKCRLLKQALVLLCGKKHLTAELALSLVSAVILEYDLAGTGEIGGYARQGSRLTGHMYAATGLDYIIKL